MDLILTNLVYYTVEPIKYDIIVQYIIAQRFPQDFPLPVNGKSIFKPVKFLFSSIISEIFVMYIIHALNVD